MFLQLDQAPDYCVKHGGKNALRNAEVASFLQLGLIWSQQVAGGQADNAQC